MPSTFVKVCKLSNVPENALSEHPLGEDGKVLLVRVGEQICAYQALCPHMEVPLVNGVFDGRIITCIEHVWQFDAATGTGIEPSDACLGRYDVSIKGDDVWVSDRLVTVGSAGTSY